jgi:hypothetical protein
MCNGECCPAGHTCNHGDNGVDYGCISIQSDSECLSNDECGKNEYCSITATYDGSIPSRYKDMKGICKSNTVVKYPTQITEGQVEGLSESDLNKINNSIYGGGGSYWSAQNFCASHGRTLFSLSDFNCASMSRGNLGYCCLTGGGNCTSDSTTQSQVIYAIYMAYNTKLTFCLDGQYDSYNATVFYPSDPGFYGTNALHGGGIMCK